MSVGSATRGSENRAETAARPAGVRARRVSRSVSTVGIVAGNVTGLRVSIVVALLLLVQFARAARAGRASQDRAHLTHT